MFGEQFEMTAKTLYGLEDVLASEIVALGGKGVSKGRRMVSYRGDKSLLYRSNYCLRTALRILVPIARLRVCDTDELYEAVKQVEWERYMSASTTFAIDSVVNSELFTHSRYVTYRVKDGIADYFSTKYGFRPSVGLSEADIYINVHISRDVCTISLDSSGESLHRRGYRACSGEAPLSEVLAAGMLELAGWRGDRALVDPMCGSGTLLIEGALMALNIYPGVFRKSYAFERWHDYDAGLFEAISSDDSYEREFGYKCYGSDISSAAIACARTNIINAGLTKYIELKEIDMGEYATPPSPCGMIVTNPPYGERITTNDISELYSMIGERLKHIFTGYEAWLLSSSSEGMDSIGLRPKRKLRLMNGELECEFRGYELFAGKKKEIEQGGVKHIVQNK